MPDQLHPLIQEINNVKHPSLEDQKTNPRYYFALLPIQNLYFEQNNFKNKINKMRYLKSIIW